MTSIAGESAALSRELADFLMELSIALHKNAIYPEGHPLLDAAVAGVERRLAALLHERPHLALGVARHQLVIEGVATDASHPLLRELAARLHRHHLGAARFHQGIARAEIADFLRTIAEDAGRTGRPLGLQHPDELARWKNVRLFPLTYEQLELLAEDDLPPPDEREDASAPAGGFATWSSAGATRSAQLWIGLARAALATESSVETPPEASDPVAVAQAIDDHGRDEAYDQVVVGYLLQIAEELKAKQGKEATALQRRISRLVSELRPETLRRLLEMGGDMTQRRRFVLDASQGMAVEAVVDLVEAAAATSQQTISHSMLRLLTKFAAHAEQGAGAARPEFDSALREQVQDLMAEWRLADPNPDAYRRALEGMSRAAPVFETAVRAFPPEPERMVQMSLEVGTVGEPLWRAVDDLVRRARFEPLLDLLDAAPDTPVVGMILAHVATPERVRELTLADTVQWSVVQRLSAHLGVAAVDPLLDALEADRHARAIGELLPTLGDDAAALAARRVDGARWTTQRALLALLQRFERVPEGWSAMPLLQGSPDAEVRREAFRLLLKDPARRDQAVALAITDRDERVARAAITAAAGGCPAIAVPALLLRATDAGAPAELRVAAVRVLAGVRTSEIRAWLLAQVTTRAGLLRRVRLAPKTPERLVALQGLARGWPDDPEVAKVVALARASADGEVRGAATPRRERPTAPFGASAVRGAGREAEPGA